MKKLIIVVALLLSISNPVFARSWRHRINQSYVPVPIVSNIQLGTFNSTAGTVQVAFNGWTDSPVCFSGKTTFIYWENYGVSLDSIINGSQDNVIKNFGSKVCANTILSLFHEANGDWDDWDGSVGNNTPQKVIKAYQHIHDIIGSKVKYAWVMNNDSFPNTSVNQPDSYYPGDAYVDIVGVDGFDWGGLSFMQAINPAFNQVKGYSKPLWITSFGTDASGQAAWITDAINQAKVNGISGLIYFSYDQFTFTSQGLEAFH